MGNGNSSRQDKLLAGGDLLLNAGMDALALTGVGEMVDIGIRAGIHLAEHVGASLVEHVAADATEHIVADTAEHIVADTTEHTVSSTADHTAADTMQHAACSFTFLTQVATDHGQHAIGTLHVGTKVLAYNPKTHTMEQEPVLHVWVHTDNDLVDLTITTTTKVQHGKSAHTTSEVVHTNQKHPFLTIEKGFLPVSQIKVGMHMLRADGKIGVITGWKVVPGAKTMYNLEVAQDHTFTVGSGQWVVHNCGGELYPNTMPEKLPGELATANKLGVKPVKVGGPGFDDVINSGKVKWAVTQDGELNVIQHSVNGEEIAHTVLTGGNPVLAAGEADIAGSGGQYMLLEIDNQSGHYLPGPETEEIGKNAFQSQGVWAP